MNDMSQQMNSREESGSASLADLVEPQSKLSLIDKFPPSALIKIGVIAGLLAWLNWWQFGYLCRIWMHNPNWSHGFIIPLFSIY